VNLREDVMRAARAAVWASAIGLWDGRWSHEQHEKILRELATFLVHLQMGAVKVDGYIPEEEVHPWECCFYPGDCHFAPESTVVDCFTFHIYPDCDKVSESEVSKTAIDAALMELRLRAGAAGTVVSRELYPRPASPNAVRIARDVVRMVRARLNNLNPIVLSSEDAYSPANAAVLAAIETGNWIAEVDLSWDAPRDISHNKLEIWMHDGRIVVDMGWMDMVLIYPTRPPRALRDAFAAAYARWYKRAAAAALVEALEGV
jgi:hypothetical protein